MKVIENPICWGFNPDPSILRVSATTITLQPVRSNVAGRQIHHSRMDGIGNYCSAFEKRLSTRFHGVSDSGGVWAPDLSHDGSRFHLVYTNTKFWSKVAKFNDTLNFLVTAERITGPWSDPVFLNSSGFDPSLFHDDTNRGGTGRKWLLNMRRDHRLNREALQWNFAAGI